MLERSRPRSGGATQECLDAETLAAWADGELSGAALEMAQTHVADCRRCQAMVGAFARTEAAAPVPTAAPAAEPSMRRWLNWLVPLTATAAALAIWIAVPRNTQVSRPAATAAQP